MYCKKCGKYIEGNAEICPECLNAEQPENQVVVENIYTSEPVQNKKEGTSGAITGFVLGLVAFIFANIDLTVFAIALTDRYRHISAAGVVVLVLLLLGVIACTILGLIFGIKAIKSFKEQKKASQKPKVVGLVFGIIDVVTAVVNFIYIFVLLIFLLALFIA